MPTFNPKSLPQTTFNTRLHLRVLSALLLQNHSLNHRWTKNGLKIEVRVTSSKPQLGSFSTKSSSSQWLHFQQTTQVQRWALGSSVVCILHSDFTSSKPHMVGSFPIKSSCSWWLHFHTVRIFLYQVSKFLVTSYFIIHTGGIFLYQILKFLMTSYPHRWDLSVSSLPVPGDFISTQAGIFLWQVFKFLVTSFPHR